MSKKKSPSSSQKSLTRRYLIWCYKTTKEELDRIDRYYTQLLVDQFILKCLTAKASSIKTTNPHYSKFLQEFEQYMKVKKENVDQKKFKNAAAGILDDHYVYLKERFDAIQKAIINFLGKKELDKIAALYDEEMTRRILEAREER